MLFIATLFLSSALLFLVQPMLAKAILPRFGGSAGVWTTCMLFFQVVLLAGYYYADWIARRLKRRVAVPLHVALLIASAAVLPLNPAPAQRFSASAQPVLAILALLARSVGLPYFMLSTTGPLAQSWYARRPGVRFPYRLFALSNLASLAALLAYPLVIEPYSTVSRQMGAWSAVYLGFIVLACGCAVRSASLKAPAEARSGTGKSWKPAGLWIGLAACASTLWLAVVNHLSQEVAAIPFLWVLPLGLYLLSFILCFGPVNWYRPELYRWILPLVWVAMGGLLAWQGSLGSFIWEILVFSAALFACCMFCHGELARRKPEAAGLTFFYLMVACGGALGGVFAGLVAPRIFSSYLELPVGIVVCVVLGLALLYGYASPRRLARTAVIAAAAFVAAVRLHSSGQNVFRERNFYGALQVSDTIQGSAEVRALYNGTILHGKQFLAPERRRLATTYFGPESGIGRALEARTGSGLRVGIIGLGAGTLASYGRPGDYYRFYEINPAVIQVATARFGFVGESAARVDLVCADGRMALESEPTQNFDVLALDAFSGDSVPVHLLSEQAFALYFRHLRAGGMVAIHVTNRYLDLAAVVQAAAQALHMQSILVHNGADAARQTEVADWVLLADSRETLRDLEPFADSQPAHRAVQPWTDDRSNLFQVLK